MSRDSKDSRSKLSTGGAARETSSGSIDGDTLRRKISMGKLSVRWAEDAGTTGPPNPSAPQSEVKGEWVSPAAIRVDNDIFRRGTFASKWEGPEGHVGSSLIRFQFRECLSSAYSMHMVGAK